jgi:hypothetical protein
VGQDSAEDVTRQLQSFYIDRKARTQSSTTTRASPCAAQFTLVEENNKPPF